MLCASTYNIRKSMMIYRIPGPKAASFNLIIEIFLFLFITVFSGLRAGAQEFSDVPIINIHGLSLPCRNCEVLDSQRCKISRQREQVMLSCEKALRELLSRIAERGYDDHYPRMGEMRSYLLDEKADPVVSALLLDFLFQSVPGRELVRREAMRFVDRYPVIIQKLIESGKGDE